MTKASLLKLALTWVLMRSAVIICLRNTRNRDADFTARLDVLLCIYLLYKAGMGQKPNKSYRGESEIEKQAQAQREEGTWLTQGSGTTKGQEM